MELGTAYPGIGTGALMKNERIVRELSPKLIRDIEQYLLVKTEIRPADLCFLFGGQNSADARIKETVRLWQSGLFNLIIVSGGPIDQSDTTEAALMAGKLKEFGVPEDRIITESRSRNTGENVAFSIQVLQERGQFESISSVLAIGRLSASRRYLMTLERHWPEVLKMLVPVNYHPVHVSKWYKDAALSNEIIAEWNKLKPYLEADFIRELNPQTCPLV